MSNRDHASGVRKSVDDPAAEIARHRICQILCEARADPAASGSGSTAEPFDAVVNLGMRALHNQLSQHSRARRVVAAGTSQHAI